MAITFTTAPPSSITLNGTVQVAATVTNDPNNYGVDWAVSCANAGNCGSMSSPHTNSGDTITYFPPASLTGNSETIDIVAFATADHSKNALAALSIQGFGNSLKGTYVFHAQGSNADATTSIYGPYAIAGVVTLDGNGGVSLATVNGQSIAGEQTITDSTRSVAASITGGNYFIGADGRGTLNLVTDDPTLGQAGTETFTFIYLSNAEALIAEADGLGSASGTLELQSKVVAPTGGYAFAVSGSDGLLQPVVIGGVLNIDKANGGISGKGSLADQEYLLTPTNCPAPTTPSGPPSVTGSVSSPDSFGAVTFNLTTCFTPNSVQFTGYLVDASHIKLVETDVNNAGTSTGFSTGGVAIGQGASTGKFTSFKGTYTYGITGFDPTGFAVSLTAAGNISSDGAGNLNGITDEYFVSGALVSDSLTGTYSVDGTGSGRVDSLITFSDPSNPPGPELIFYQTGNGNPPLVLDLDSSFAAVGSGIAYQQGAAPFAFGGAYGLNFTQMAPYAIETDGTGQMVVDNSADTLAGFLDGFGFPNSALSGTFDSSFATGRFAGVLSAPNATGTAAADPAPVEFYLIDKSHGFFIENDLIYTSLGYFAPRTPVCPTCP